MTRRVPVRQAPGAWAVFARSSRQSPNSAHGGGDTPSTSMTRKPGEDRRQKAQGQEGRRGSAQTKHAASEVDLDLRLPSSEMKIIIIIIIIIIRPSAQSGAKGPMEHERREAKTKTARSSCSLPEHDAQNHGAEEMRQGAERDRRSSLQPRCRVHNGFQNAKHPQRTTPTMK